MEPSEWETLRRWNSDPEVVFLMSMLEGELQG
jgi:hypothetical protein